MARRLSNGSSLAILEQSVGALIETSANHERFQRTAMVDGRTEFGLAELEIDRAIRTVGYEIPDAARR